MFKRRDWINLKGADGKSGGADSSSDDSDSDDEERRARFSNRRMPGAEESESADGSGSDESDEGDGNDGGAASESDEGEGEEESSEEESETGPSAQDVIDAWTGEDTSLHGFKSIPLRCMPCNALLLNRVTYLQHVASKTHRKKVKARGSSVETSIILARHANIAVEEEAETHAERLARLRAFSTVAGEAAAGADAKVANGEEGSSDEEGGPAPRRRQAAEKKRVPSAGGSAEGPSGSGGGGSSSDGGATVALAEEAQAVATAAEAAEAGAKADKASAGKSKGKKRLGKRQREALKAEGKDPSTGKKFKARKKQEAECGRKHLDGPVTVSPGKDATSKKDAASEKTAASVKAATSGKAAAAGKAAAGGKVTEGKPKTKSSKVDGLVAKVGMVVSNSKKAVLKTSASKKNLAT